MPSQVPEVNNQLGEHQWEHVPSRKAATDATFTSFGTLTDTVCCIFATSYTLLIKRYPMNPLSTCRFEIYCKSDMGRSRHTASISSGMLIWFMHTSVGRQDPRLEYLTKLSSTQLSSHVRSSTLVRQILPTQSVSLAHFWSGGMPARLASECVTLSDRAILPLDSIIGDANVEERWLTVRKIVVMVTAKSMMLQGKY